MNRSRSPAFWPTSTVPRARGDEPYIHRGEDGHDVATLAYLEGEIEPAVDLFLSDAKQATAQMCESPMLDGRRFRYVKATDGQGEPA